jgi:tRNA (guanosine-2'-O-)-methyltransferase
MQEIDQTLINYLSGFVNERRKERLREVLSERTRHLTIVLEDIYQGHNASAVLRSCDCFGIQDVHFIENKNTMKISDDVAMGSYQWLTINRIQSYPNNSLQCITELKKKGYRIVATTPHANDKNISELDINTPLALVFGTEITGVSQTVLEQADEFVKIPMYGFTESFNISVCAAICMYELSNRLRKSGISYKLPEQEKDAVYLEWLKASIRRSDAIVNAFYKNNI